MNWINYHHLLYFYTVVKEGSIAKACLSLHISQPAISSQLRALENLLGEKLLSREGRGLVTTEVGKIVYQYADEIFGLGQEMLEALKGRPTGKALKLRVGIADVLAKKIAFKLIEPALQLKEKVQIICYENKIEQLMTSLMLHELDIVLSDAPIPTNLRIQGFSHFLGDCAISILGTPKLAKTYRKNFPQSLDKAPFLMPFEGTVLRHSLNRWFEKLKILPLIQGEFEDSALLKEFGNQGIGLFAVPKVIYRNVMKDHGAEHVGDIVEIKESFYVISMERKLKHPAVGAIVDNAKRRFFN